jgi:dihydrofolate synthase/folylpolyglutamate synthase
MRDKRLDQIGEILFPSADLLILTTIENPRSASIEMLEPIANRFAKGTVVKTRSSVEAQRVATEMTPSNGLICIAGSLYLIGEMRSRILNQGKEDDYST